MKDSGWGGQLSIFPGVYSSLDILYLPSQQGAFFNTAGNLLAGVAHCGWAPAAKERTDFSQRTVILLLEEEHGHLAGLGDLLVPAAPG